MSEIWDADPSADLVRRIGKSPQELGTTGGDYQCPDIWELSNSDIVVVGRDLTTSYAGRLPEGLVVGPGERLVVIPRITLQSAAGDMGGE